MNSFRTPLLAILTLACIVAFSACALIKGIEFGSPEKPIIADTTVFVIFNDSSNINLSSEDLSQIDSILQQCINENLEQKKTGEELNKKHRKRKPENTSHMEYKRQYFPGINDKGEKVVWVNCFCHTSRDWKKQLIMVEDGGSCYFNVTINLTTGKYYHLRVNGVA